MQKHEEYPGIDWENLEDEKVQIATILYNDRVLTWKKLKQLDEELDSSFNLRSVMNMAETRIRNLLAFSELQSYNDTGNFRYKHPLITHRSERAELQRLHRSDPLEFLRRYRRCSDSIRRYAAYLKRPERSDRRAQDKEHLRRFRDRESLFKSIIEESNNK